MFNDGAGENVSSKAYANYDPGVGPPNAEKSSGCCDRLFFFWVSPLVRLGNKQSLEEKDVWQLNELDDVRDLVACFDTAKKELIAQGKKAGLYHALKKVHAPAVNLAVCFELFCSILIFAQVLLINQFLEYFVNGPAACTVTATQQDQMADSSNNSLTRPCQNGVFVDPYPDWYGFAMCGLLFLDVFLYMVLQNKATWIATRTGLHVRATTSALVFRKAASLSPSARNESTMGEILNFMMLDAENLMMSTLFLPKQASMLLQIVVLFALLAYLIGWPAIFAICFQAIVMPCAVTFFVQQAKLQKEKMVQSDLRTKLVNEIFQAIRVVKFYAWEDSFVKRVGSVRQKELDKLLSLADVKAKASVFLHATPAFMIAIIFTLVAYNKGGRLGVQDVPQLFTALLIIVLLRMPLMFTVFLTFMMIQARVSLKRLGPFMDAEELQPVQPAPSLKGGEAEFGQVLVQDATFDWGAVLNPNKDDATRPSSSRGGGGDRGRPEAPTDKSSVPKSADGTAEGKNTHPVAVVPEDVGVDVTKGSTHALDGNGEFAAAAEPVVLEPFKLYDINLDCRAGTLTAVIGSVGSGKSSFLQGIAGGMKLVSGGVSVRGRLALVSQQVWLTNHMLRDNVRFNSEWDQEKYSAAVERACLLDDIRTLPGGHEAEIGERGVNLSGGQKQRISIARALYSDADIYLFDDPLSALDAHVGKEVFNNVIKKLRDDGKTVIIVMNQLQMLPEVDNIVVISRGRIVECGTYSSLLSGGQEFTALMERTGLSSSGSDGAGNSSTQAHDGETGGKDCGNAALKEKEKVDVAVSSQNGALVVAEERKSGAVEADVWITYITATGTAFLFFFCVFLNVLNNFSSVAVEWWISFWTTDSIDPYPGFGFYVSVFFALALVVAGLLYSKTLAFAWMGVWASKNLHHKMLHSAIFGSSAFFDRTPVGWMVSRFSSDVQKIDEQLPQMLDMCITSILLTLSSFVVMSVVTPLVLCFLIPLIAWYAWVVVYYKRAFLEIKRLDSTTRSPVYSHFSESLAGITTIRAYGQVPEFVQDNVRRLNRNNRQFMAMKSMELWLATRLQTVGIISITAVSVISVLFRASPESAYVGLLGLMFTHALRVTGTMQWMSQNITNMEAQMNSVERAKHYINTIEQDGCGSGNKPLEGYQGDAAAPAVTARIAASLPKEGEWPSKGSIQFTDYSLKYATGEPVLKHVSATIGGGEKIGVVGRTGAGKSSLMLGLFRLIEAHTGKCSIDGLDIASLPVTFLRRHLSMIPQDPVLFSGTVRNNLDPFDLGDRDDRLWAALEQVRLKDHIAGLDGKLDAPVAEFGANFSVGQKQLICMARALVRDNKILVMDEATSSVDMDTDQVIQHVVRSSFSDCTLLVIAHRINTIIDSNRVMCLKLGQIEEFEHPAVLLRDPTSMLSSLVDEYSEGAAAGLRAEAEAAFEMEQKRFAQTTSSI